MSSLNEKINYSYKTCDLFLNRKANVSKTHIVIDSVNVNYDDSSNETDVSRYIDRQLYKSSNGKTPIFYNYMIDRKGGLFGTLEEDTSSNCCKFDVYSRKASTTFPKLCPPTDGRLSPREFSPDDACITIGVCTNFDSTTGNEDTGELSKEAYLTLFNTVASLIEDNESIKNNTDSILIRRMFPGEDIQLNNCGKLFAKPLSFMIFKNEIALALRK